MSRLLLFILLFTTFLSHGQGKERRHEIGISIFKVNATISNDCFSFDMVTPMQSILSSPCYWGAKMYNSMTPELYYSYHFYKKLRLRASIGQMKYTQQIPNPTFHPDYWVYKRTNFSLGLQWEFMKRKNWNLYTAGGLIYSRQKSEYLRRDGDLSVTNILEEKNSRLRPMALLGAKYQLSKRISCSIESGINTRISPLSRLSVDYHF